MRNERVVTTCDMHDDDTHPEHEPIKTVRFGIDGDQLEIDLCDPQERELRDLLQRYADAGRKVSPTNVNGTEKSKRGEASRKVREQREKLAAVRDFARKNGWKVSDRGRLPAEVVEAFEKVNGGVNAGTNGQQADPEPAATNAEQQHPEHQPAEAAEHQHAGHQHAGTDTFPPEQHHGEHDRIPAPQFSAATN